MKMNSADVKTVIITSNHNYVYIEMSEADII